MSGHGALLEIVLRGRSDANIRFSELRKMLLHLGFEERTRGSHHIYRKKGVVELINLQLDKASAKPCQIKQILRLLLKDNIGENQ